jgi:hypothetical protein
MLGRLSAAEIVQVTNVAGADEWLERGHRLEVQEGARDLWKGPEPGPEALRW